MNIKKYKIKIRGITPLIWNVMKRELEEEKKELKKDQLVEWEEKSWRKKAEYNDKKEVLLPNRWIKGAMITACMQARFIPHFATMKNQTYTSYVKSCVIDESKSVAKNEKSLEYFGQYLSSQGTKGTGGKVWRVRPLLKKWETEFTFVDAFGRMKKSELEDILDYTGSMVGIGDNRRNNFGRFEVTDIKEVN